MQYQSATDRHVIFRFYGHDLLSVHNRTKPVQRWSGFNFHISLVQLLTFLLKMRHLGRRLRSDLNFRGIPKITLSRGTIAR